MVATHDFPEPFCSGYRWETTLSLWAFILWYLNVRDCCRQVVGTTDVDNDHAVYGNSLLVTYDAMFACSWKEINYRHRLNTRQILRRAQSAPSRSGRLGYPIFLNDPHMDTPSDIPSDIFTHDVRDFFAACSQRWTVFSSQIAFNKYNSRKVRFIRKPLLQVSTDYCVNFFFTDGNQHYEKCRACGRGARVFADTSLTLIVYADFSALCTLCWPWLTLHAADCLWSSFSISTNYCHGVTIKPCCPPIVVGTPLRVGFSVHLILPSYESRKWLRKAQKHRYS
jgi:hypothetical protein